MPVILVWYTLSPTKLLQQNFSNWQVNVEQKCWPAKDKVCYNLLSLLFSDLTVESKLLNKSKRV